MNLLLFIVYMEKILYSMSVFLYYLIANVNMILKIYIY